MTASAKYWRGSDWDTEFQQVQEYEEEFRMTSYRDRIVTYVKETWQVPEEHLWRRFPDYVIFRHEDNQKWFGLIMDVPGTKLGLAGEETVDILNVKLGDPILRDMLIRQEGFLKGYHISRGNWISILLDGTVDFAEICRWLEESFMVTASKETKHRLRPPKEWIIPANPKYYDVEAAFARADEIDWKQGKGIKTGDTVFMYVAAPVSAVLYQCLVTETDISYRYDDGNVRIKTLMKIRLIKRFTRDRFTFDVLGKEYGIHAVRGPRGIPDSLSRDFHEAESLPEASVPAGS